MKRITCLTAAILLGIGIVCIGTVSAEENPSSLQELEAAKRSVSTQRYDLRYRFAEGDISRWKAVELVTVETKIQGVSETAQTRSASTKRWQVSKVDTQGNITFVYSVEAVDMWQKVSGRAVIRYNSQTDKEPPAAYKFVAESVGVPLATITINSHGQIVKRENERPQMKPWIGELVLPMPGKPVTIGYRWAVPEEIVVRLEEGTGKRVKLRQLYQLEKVAGSVATISSKTQILTPIKDPKIKSQLVQRMKQGTIQFDLKQGRVIAKQINLDETIYGFSGPESIMQHLARFTEELVDGRKASAETPAASEARRRRGDGPKLRR